MARKLSEVIAEIQQIESDGGDASELRGKVSELGYGDRLPAPPTMVDVPETPQAPEPTFLDNWGRPIAETGGALLGGFAGLPAGLPGMMLGAGAGGEAAGAIFDRLNDEPARSPTETMMGVAFNSMGGPAPSPKSLYPVIRNTQDDLAVNAARDMGIERLTPGQSSSGGSRVEGWLESTLTGGPVLDRQRQGVVDKSRSYIEDLFPTNLSRAEMGDRAALAVGEEIGDKKAIGSGLYDELQDILDAAENGRISLPESRRLVAEMDAKYASDPEWAKLINTDPDLMRFYQSAKDNPMPPMYNTMKEFRTTVGANLDNPWTPALGGVEREKRRLYGTLSGDLAGGAEELGGVGARQARNRADWYNRGLQTRLEKIDPVFKNSDNPEKVFDAMSLMARNNVTGLRAVKQTLPNDVWDEFASTYMRRLFSPKPGMENALGDALSFNTIATNLNKMGTDSPEGLKLIAGDASDAVENLRLLSNRMKDSERFINRSRTANASNLGGLLGSTASAAGTGYFMGGVPGAVAAGTASLGGGTLIPYLAAKSITSPSVARAIEKIPFSTMDESQIAAALKSILAATGDEL